MRILYLAFRFPYPPNDGSKIRMYHIAQLLAREHQVDLLAIAEEPVTPEAVRMAESVFHRVLVHPCTPARLWFNAFRGLFNSDPIQTAYYHLPQIQRWIDRHQSDYDVMICGHLRMAKYLKGRSCRKVVDLIDATSLLYEEADGKVRGVWKLLVSVERARLPRYERQVLTEFDRALITSNFDKEYVQNHGAGCEVVLVPNGVRAELLKHPAAVTEEDALCFFGKMNTLHNSDAAIHFARGAFRRLKRLRPNLQFWIVGMQPTRAVRRLRRIKGIEVTGTVADPYEYLARAKVVVVPLRFGAGVQNKVLEAMALRKAIVTTPPGARGLAAVSGCHLLVAHNEQDLIDKILSLLDDEEARRKLGASARQLIEERYTWEAAGEKLIAVIAGLSPSQPVSEVS